MDGAIHDSLPQGQHRQFVQLAMREAMGNVYEPTRRVCRVLHQSYLREEWYGAPHALRTVSACDIAADVVDSIVRRPDEEQGAGVRQHIVPSHHIDSAQQLRRRRVRQFVRALVASLRGRP